MIIFILSVIITYILFKKVILPWARKDSIINAEENKKMYPSIFGFDCEPEEEQNHLNNSLNFSKSS